MYNKLQTTVKYGYIVVGMSLGKRAKESEDTGTTSDNFRLDEKSLRGRFTLEIGLAARLTCEALTALRLLKIRQNGTILRICRHRWTQQREAKLTSQPDVKIGARGR